MSTIKHGIALAALLVAVAAPTSAQPATGTVPIAAFQVRTAGDLAALCGAMQSDPNYVAAIHFCHGFLQGPVSTMAPYGPLADVSRRCSARPIHARL